MTNNVKALYKKDVELKPPYPYQELREFNNQHLKPTIEKFFHQEFRISIIKKRKFLKKIKKYRMKFELLKEKNKDNFNGFSFNSTLSIQENFQNIFNLVQIRFKKLFYKILYNFFVFFENMKFLKAIYNSNFIWCLLGLIQLLFNKKLYVFLIKKLVIRIYAHRVHMHKRIKSIPVDKGVIFALFPFIISTIQVFGNKYKPFTLWSNLEYNFPLLSPPKQVIKWETLMLSERALKILAKEKNKIVFCGDHILIHRNKTPNLFGNVGYKNYILKSKQKPIQTLNEILGDFDEFPIKLSSNKRPAPFLINKKRIESFLKYKTTDQSLNFFLKKIDLYNNLTRIDFILRNEYIHTDNIYELWAALHETLRNQNKQLQENSKQKKELKSSFKAENGIPPRIEGNKKRKKRFFILPKEEEITQDKKEWPKLNGNGNEAKPLPQKYIKRFILYEVYKRILESQDEVIEDFSKILKTKEKNILEILRSQLFERKKQIDFDLLREKIPDACKISLQDEGTPKIDNNFLDLDSYNELDDNLVHLNIDSLNNPLIKEVYEKNPELLQCCLEKVGNKYRKLIEDPRIFVRPRVKSGYKYPDSNFQEVKRLRFYDYLTQFKKTTVIKVDLPPNFLATQVFPMKYPELPKTKDISIATATTTGLWGRITKNLIFPNALSTLYEPPEYMSREEKEDKELYEYLDKHLKNEIPDKLPYNYRGPGICVDENNDIVIKDNAKKSKIKNSPIAYQTIPMDFLFGNDETKPKNTQENLKKEELKKNSLRSWLINYAMPDNSTSRRAIIVKKGKLIETINRGELNRRAGNNLDYQRMISREFGNYSFRIRRTGYWRKWAVFPYTRTYLDSPTLSHPFLPANKIILLVGFSENQWIDRCDVKEELILPIWVEEAITSCETLDNANYERKRSIAELKGNFISILPTTSIYWPDRTKRPKLFFGFTSGLDYRTNSSTMEFLFKVFQSIMDPYVVSLDRNSNFDRFFTNTAAQNIYNNLFYSEAWEPLTKNFWLIICHFSFWYLGGMLIKTIATIYSREFLTILFDMIKETGFLPSSLQKEFEILVGRKDSGYRIAYEKEFTKGFGDIVGIDKFIGHLMEIVLYLRGGIGNADLAKNAQTLLLVGPPGTGKTIIVHALAVEAGVPVLTLTAEGAKEPDALDRLFRKARKIAPCIVFFDEVDAIGFKREGVLGFEDVLNDDFLKKSIRDIEVSETSTILGDVNELNPHFIQNKEEFHKVVNRDVYNSLIKKNDDEYYRVGVLSKLLVELDGIQNREGIVIIGATNRVNVLDPALLRPGRFNARLRISLPTQEKRLDLFQFYSKPLGSELNIPWDYLAKVTYGYSAADIAMIMNESCMKAVTDGILHSLETIEHGIDRLAIDALSIPEQKRKEAKNKKIFYNFSIVRNAHYQAAKILVGTLLKHHPPILVVHLDYREYTSRYKQIQQTTLVEWLKYVYRGEFEHRILGAFAGKAGELFFLQKNKEQLTESDSSDIGAQDWKIAQALLLLFIDKWNLYTPKITLLQEQVPLLADYNIFTYKDIKEQYLFEFARTLEIFPNGLNFLGAEKERNPQTRFALNWWQLKIQEEYLSLEIQKWYSIWIPDPEEWNFNPLWISPDSTYHQNATTKDLNFATKYKDLFLLFRDYQFHSIILDSIDTCFSILTQFTELFDLVVQELLDKGILREYQIYDIFEKYGINCKQLKEDLNNIPVEMPELPKDFKIITPSWGEISLKPGKKWLNIAAMRGVIDKENKSIQLDDEGQSLNKKDENS
uniref:cell division protein FtsH n=1 Tax=Prototheca lentecrescens TaxID=2836214 RepID=UPI0030010879